PSQPSQARTVSSPPCGRHSRDAVEQRAGRDRYDFAAPTGGTTDRNQPTLAGSVFPGQGPAGHGESRSRRIREVGTKPVGAAVVLLRERRLWVRPGLTFEFVEAGPGERFGSSDSRIDDRPPGTGQSQDALFEACYGAVDVRLSLVAQGRSREPS